MRAERLCVWLAQAIGGVALGLAAAQVVLALFRPKPVRDHS